MICNPDNIKDILLNAVRLPPYSRLIMSDPGSFRVEYAINPHMLEADGSLKQVNSKVALKQWNSLIATYRSLGLEVSLIKSESNLPDMVYTANQSLQVGEKEIILSQMASKERAKEVDHFERFYQSIGWTATQIEADKFEGMGDAIWHPGKRVIWGGYGFRSSLDAYQNIIENYNIPIIPLRLIDERFYHLDTCFFVINPECAAYLPGAFDKESIECLRNGFTDLIEIDLDEAIHNFAGNAFCPDGKHVILQSGALKLCHQLKSRDLKPIEVETSEFIKGGGSCFCLKMALY